MYYPYFRGRQNELLCLRELLENQKIGEKIIPIIEPVRFNSGLLTTISKFVEMNREIILIENPKVGRYGQDCVAILDDTPLEEEKERKKRERDRKVYHKYIELIKSELVIKALLMDENVYMKCERQEINVEEVVLINTDKGNYKYYEDTIIDLRAKITLIPKDEDFKDEVSGKVVLLEDGYVKAKRNVDYIDEPDEHFSRNHLVYERRGYVGFSDYSMVGNEYTESGFAPLAIAIHILYFGKKNELRVHHFVSESNDTFYDPARKFEEAMLMLVAWEELPSIPKTYGLTSLINYYKEGRFPGLGVIKKCSLMHHLEIVNEFLEEK